jgi:hypothetical protein
MEIPTVTILQTDNRINDKMVELSISINQIACNSLKYEYKFINILDIIHKYNINHTWDKMNYIIAKIYVLFDFMDTCKTDFIVFLDSDAWIQEKYYLNDLINNLHTSNFNGAFSRDPYVKQATFINSGSFILKNNNFVKNMYKNIINEYQIANNKKYLNDNNFILDKKDTNDNLKKVFGDQYFISYYVYIHKQDFLIFKPNILNTPDGIVLRHHWWKHIKLYSDAKNILNSNYVFKKDIFNFDENFDNKPYPSYAEQNATNMYCSPIETAIKYGLSSTI